MPKRSMTAKPLAKKPAVAASETINDKAEVIDLAASDAGPADDDAPPQDSTLTDEELAELKRENEALEMAAMSARPEEKPSLGNKFLDWQKTVSDEPAPPKKGKDALKAEVAQKNKDRLARLAKGKADAKALREAKKIEDAAAKGAPTTGQLVVAAEKQQKAAVIAEQVRERSAFLDSLNPFAKEINHRFELATQLDGKADDHRLAASLKIAEAKKLCDENGVRFKDWAEQNIKEQSYDYVKRLAGVGAAPDPKLALEDMRRKNAELNVKHRAVKKQKERTLVQRAEVVGAMPAADAATDIATAAAALIAAPIPSRKPAAQPTGIDALKHAFAALKASDQMAFVKWAAEEVGAALDFSFGEDVEKGSATAEAQFLNQASA